MRLSRPFGLLTAAGALLATGVLGIAQMPLYGLLLALGAQRQRLRRYAAVLAAVHGVALLLCFVVPMPDFS